MAVDTNLEREYKFDVDADFEPPDLRPVVGRTERLPEQRLVSTYFDTTDHRLWACGITLRHRSAKAGREVAGGKWTLKLPTSESIDEQVSVRSELNWPGESGRVPAEIEQVIAGVVRREPLVPLAALSSVRQRLLLHRPDDRTAVWAELDDDTVTVTAGGRKGTRFRQLELELIGPPPARRTLDEVLEQLGRAGAGPGGGSKIGLAAGLEPPRQAAAGTDLASVASALIARDLGRLLVADYRLRTPPEGPGSESPEPGSVRAAGTAIRRLRADLQILKAVLDPVWYRHVAAELRHLDHRLNPLVEEDGLVQRVLRQARDAEAANELVGIIRADRHLRAAEVGEHLASGGYIDTIDRLHAASSHPPLRAGMATAGSVGPLSEALDRRWRALVREMKRLDDCSPPEVIHHLRIRSEKLRYAAQSTERLLGRRTRRTGRAARRLQSVLGDLDDALRASAELGRFSAHPSLPPAVSFEAGRIAGRAEVEAESRRGSWRPAAKTLRHRPVRR